MSTGTAFICASCTRYQPFDAEHPRAYCAAFPDGIPADIIYGGFDHRVPHANDHGIGYVANVRLADLLATFDKIHGNTALTKYSDDQERDDHGRWTTAGHILNMIAGGIAGLANPDYIPGDTLGDWRSPLDGETVKPITPSEARGNSRGVSHAEFHDLARDGRKMLAALHKDSSPPTGLIDNHERIVDRAVIESHKSWGGVTVDAHTGEEIHRTSGFALTVKAPGQHSVSLPESASHEQMDRAVKEALSRFPQLANAQHALGIFHDDDHKRIDVDPVLIVDSPRQVEAIGAFTHAIGGAYDFSTGNGYFPPHVVMGGHVRDREKVGKGMTRRSIEGRRVSMAEFFAQDRDPDRPLDTFDTMTKAYNEDQHPRDANGRWTSGDSGDKADNKTSDPHKDDDKPVNPYDVAVAETRLHNEQVGQKMYKTKAAIEKRIDYLIEKYGHPEQAVHVLVGDKWFSGIYAASGGDAEAYSSNILGHPDHAVIVAHTGGLHELGILHEFAHVLHGDTHKTELGHTRGWLKMYSQLAGEEYGRPVRSLLGFMGGLPDTAWDDEMGTRLKKMDPAPSDVHTDTTPKKKKGRRRIGPYLLDLIKAAHDVSDEARDDHGRWTDGGGPALGQEVLAGMERLAPDEKAAVTSYTTTKTARYLNAMLRFGAMGQPMDSGRNPLTLVHDLDGAVAKGVLTADMTLSRGMQTTHQFKVGETFTDHGYVSTASDPRIAASYAAGMDGRAPGAALTMVIDAPAGTHAIEGKASLSEIILPRDSRFRVTEVNASTNTVRVDLL